MSEHTKTNSTGILPGLRANCREARPGSSAGCASRHRDMRECRSRTLLIFGGIFSFLPVLGLWMLPLGLLLFAQDVPVLQKPTARMLGWIERKWIERQRAKNAE